MTAGLRSRARRPRRGEQARAADPASPAVAASVAWEDLSEAERTALKRMNRGPYPGLDEATALRLIGLGLAVARPGGIGISRAGRELVIGTLLEARREHQDL